MANFLPFMVLMLLSIALSARATFIVFTTPFTEWAPGSRARRISGWMLIAATVLYFAAIAVSFGAFV